ncbi:hypothetical protein CN203_37125 [Sinorhizobium meliloti]|nr:hypothetical protein CN203_37125 [Sinorhizobium meliloti]RVH89437.1 hypothetical protein CN206_38065 [Sinorhizobium meliloti]
MAEIYRGLPQDPSPQAKAYTYLLLWREPLPRRETGWLSLPIMRHRSGGEVKPLVVSPTRAGESHLANKRLFCCGKSILGVLR